MPPNNYYDIDDYIHHRIVNTINYELPEEVKNTIQLLEKIAIQNEEKTALLNNTTNPNTTTSFVKKNFQVKVIVDRDRKRSNFHRGNKELEKKLENTDWKSIAPVCEFKPMKIEIKEGIEKLINEIRVSLNKLSNKNMEVQKKKIIELINEVFTMSNETEIVNENMKRIIKIIYDVASSNKFFSELYSDLYKELAGLYEVIHTQLTDILESYKEIFNTIQYVDSNVDYDGYCNYVKKSDMRKAISSLIVNLTKKEVLLKDDVIEIVIYLQEIIMKYAEETGRTNEVEEMCDNLFILIVEGHTILSTSEKWTNTVLPKVMELTKLKKEHGPKYPSITSRAGFKCIDILDKLKITTGKK